MSAGKPYVRTKDRTNKSDPALEAAYGLLGCNGKFSSALTSGRRSPYTSSVEICRNRCISSVRATWSRMNVPVTLVRVTDVALHEPISGIPRNRVQIGKISRVGQLVEVDDAMTFAERENIPDEVRTNKPSPTCNKDFH